MITSSHIRSTSPMLCDASSMVQPALALVGSSSVRIRSPTSGSSEAVGSSSSSTSGRLSNALARIRACAGRPTDRRMAARARSTDRTQAPARRCAPGRAHAIEVGKDAQVLGDRQALRHVDIRRREIDARQHAVAMPQHVAAEHANRAGRRREHAEQHGQRRRLARAVAAEQGGRGAGAHVEADALHGIDVLERFAQLANFDDGGGVGGGR